MPLDAGVEKRKVPCIVRSDDKDNGAILEKKPGKHRQEKLLGKTAVLET